MKELDQIIYEALTSDATITEAVGDRIVSTCFEVSPEEVDNTPLPCIIVTDDGFQNQSETKDEEWETTEDRVTATIEVDADSPKEVKRLVRLCRKAVANAIREMTEAGEETPVLDSVIGSQIAWDWMKPCYYQNVTYNCIIDNDNEQDQ